MKYDVGILKTVAECRRVMARARQQGNETFYQEVFRRMCQLSATAADLDSDDPLAKDFFAVLAAYEQLLTEKNGKTTTASRTRQKLKNKGIEQSLTDWATSSSETSGFKLLVDAGLPELTAEYVVASYPGRFSEAVIERAKSRLLDHGIKLP